MIIVPLTGKAEWKDPRCKNGRDKHENYCTRGGCQTRDKRPASAVSLYIVPGLLLKEGSAGAMRAGAKGSVYATAQQAHWHRGEQIS